jgi:hypothetical protein
MVSNNLNKSKSIVIMSELGATKTESSNEKDIFSDIKYICNSTSLIVDSLKKGLDVAQLPSGDIIVTEIKTVNTQYSWSDSKQRMIKVSQSSRLHK